MFCRRCSNKVKDNQEFCEKCGFNIKLDYHPSDSMNITNTGDNFNLSGKSLLLLTGMIGFTFLVFSMIFYV